MESLKPAAILAAAITALVVILLLAAGCAADPKTRLYQFDVGYKAAIQVVDAQADAGNVTPSEAKTYLAAIKAIDSARAVAQAAIGGGDAFEAAFAELEKNLESINAVQSAAKKRSK